MRKEFTYKHSVHKKVVDKPESDEPLTKKSKYCKVVIKVHPDQHVVATAPIDATNLIIHDAMMKRARWIWRSLQDFAKQQDHVLLKRCISGETQFYLGRRYVLKVITDAETNDVINSTVKLSRGKLKVVFPQSDAEVDAEERSALVKSIIERWYRDKFASISRERLEALMYKAS